MKSNLDNSFSRADLDLLLRFFAAMVKCRRVEEKTADLFEGKEIRCPVHLYLGQEAVAVGVCTALRREDYVFGNHRSHGHYIAKGGELRPLFAEFLGKETGCACGRGGSMHLIDVSRGILGTTPIVAAGIPMAVGAALASSLKKDGKVSVAFFGDGATEEGAFHESMNLASLWSLPVVFVCENNFYASHLPLSARRRKDNLFESGVPYAMPSARVNGNDVRSVYAHASAAVDHARRGCGPSFIECRTYRWRGHVGPAWEWNLGIRSREEVEEWMARCPIRALENDLLSSGAVRPEDLEEIRLRIDAEIEDAVTFARESPYPPAETLLRNVYLEPLT